jgi:PAT family beta-lactamase induction signal transducer AmpG
LLGGGAVSSVVSMNQRNPWVYIPTLYFAEGLPYTVVMMMSAVYFKDLGASNVLIGLTSILQLPWIFKFVWAPLIDFFGWKKYWIVIAQLILGCLFAGMALSAVSPDPVNLGLWILGACALASATHDAAIDGYYLEVLDKSEQALFVGVRNTAFRMSMIFGSGAMVFLAGMLAQHMDKHNAWMSSFAILSAVMLSGVVFHSFYLPRLVLKEELVVSPARPVAVAAGATGGSSVAGGSAASGAIAGGAIAAEHNYFRAIFSYFNQPGIVAIVFYIILFRLGDALVMKMIPPFLQDPGTKGGLGLTVETVGTIYGTVGVGFLLLGGIVGGYLVSKQGLRRWFWPATLIMNGTILLYWLLASLHPSSIAWVYVVNSLEQFGYGLGMAAYTVFLLGTVKQEHKAAHYAVATALMALGLMIPGMTSGFLLDGFKLAADSSVIKTLQAMTGNASFLAEGFNFAGLGYANFFLLSFCLTLPGIISICFLPIWRKNLETA